MAHLSSLRRYAFTGFIHLLIHQIKCLQLRQSVSTSITGLASCGTSVRVIIAHLKSPQLQSQGLRRISSFIIRSCHSSSSHCSFPKRCAKSGQCVARSRPSESLDLLDRADDYHNSRFTCVERLGSGATRLQTWTNRTSLAYPDHHDCLLVTMMKPNSAVLSVLIAECSQRSRIKGGTAMRNKSWTPGNH